MSAVSPKPAPPGASAQIRRLCEQVLRHLAATDVAVWRGSTHPQRAVPRALRPKLGDDPDEVCRAYVEAEVAGLVPRPHGAGGMTPGAHARTLWQEGKLKGWLER